MASADRPTQVEVATDPQTLAHSYAEWLRARIAGAAAPFRIALCGGATPQPLYRILGSAEYRSRIDWSKLRIFWGDERFVPPNHPDSNLGLARALWLDHVPLTPDQIHPMPTYNTLETCAARYEALLKAEYGACTFDPARPLFDVMLLGIGADGHTASLLPGAPALDERVHWAAAVPHGRTEARITLTYPAIASSAAITFLATGAQKAAAVAAARRGERPLPAARVAGGGELIWFLDRAAAGENGNHNR